MRRGPRLAVAAGITLVLAATACSGSSSPRSGGASSATTGAVDRSLGTGVTASTIKVGVLTIDYSCIQQFIDSIEPDQQKAYQVYIDDINGRGGINGRKIVPVYKSYCPPPVHGNEELTACTSLTDDDKVFAVIGTLYDPTGAAQLCFAKNHHTPIVGSPLTQDMITKAPPGLMVTPDITDDRRLRVILALLAERHTLDGKKVAVVDSEADSARVNTVVKPKLAQLGVARGTDATLTITSADTTAAQAQLASFIEHWKSDGTNALLLVGAEVSSKQFVEKIKAALPAVQLVSDTTSVLDGARDEQKAHVTPNPYDGIISAEGQTGIEHTKTPHFTFCRDIWEKATHIPVPSPNVVIKLPNGKQNNIYGEVEDACVFTHLFDVIAQRVGPYLNNSNWVKTVDSYGSVDDTSTIYATLHRGKYDADDTYGLVAYDPTIGADGDWVHVTPVENVGNA